MRWQDGALEDQTGSGLLRAVISIVHPVPLQQTSWHEKHPAVVALAPDTTSLRGSRPCAMLDGDHQRASMAASFTVFFASRPNQGQNLRECRSMNSNTRLWRVCASTATTMTERSRRTKGNVDKLAEYKRVREGGSRKYKVRMAHRVLGRALTRQSARGRYRIVRRDH